MVEQTNEQKIELLLNSAHGIYIPQLFVNGFNMEDWHVSDDKWAIETLKEGPDNELYWDAWDQLTSNAHYQGKDNKWTLMQDGDLWAVREDYDWENDTCFLG